MITPPVHDSFDSSVKTTFQCLHAMFSNLKVLEGDNSRFQMEACDGKVYVQLASKSDGHTVDVQWFGATEPFGFTLLPNGSTWGPYHFH